MDSDSNEDKNTQRCPRCGWVSVTKLVDDTHIRGTYFTCQNSECSVERIYGDNCIYEKPDSRD